MESPVSIHDPGHTVGLDISCSRCGYNLRGLAGDGRCPECNTPVGVSTLGDLLRFADPDYADRLATGAFLILWGLLIAIVIGMIGGIIMATTGKQLVGQLIALVGSSVMYVGTWLLTSRDPSGIGDEKYGLSRKIVRAGLLIGLVQNAIALALQDGAALSSGLRHFFVVVSIVCGIGSTVGQIVAMNYFRLVALRIPDQALAARARLLMWGCGICLPLMAIGASLVLFDMARNGMAAPGGGFTMAIPVGGAPPNLSTLFWTGSCLTTLGAIPLLVFGVMALFLMYRVGRACREQAATGRAIRSNWAPTGAATA